MKKYLSLFLIFVCVVVVSCNTTPSEPAVPTELEELANGQVETQTTVGLEVLGVKKAPTITNQFHPSIGSQMLYEVQGTTPKGRTFKAVLLGSERINLSKLSGQGQMRARLARVQNQAILTGIILAPEVSNQPIAFIAAGQNANFTGPLAGSVHEFTGTTRAKGRCAADALGGSFGLEQPNRVIRGSFFGLPDGTKTFGCVLPEIDDEVLVAFSSTAVQTHLGIVLSLHGSLAGNATQTGIAGRASTNVGAPGGGMGIPNQDLEPANSQINLEAKSNVRELGPDSSSELISFHSRTGTLTFRSLRGNLVGLQVNDLVVSAPLTLTPDGFMRRVTSIQSSNSQVVVQTERSVLGDLVEEADIRIEETVDFLEVQRAKAWQRGEVIYTATQMQNLRPQNLLPQIDESFNWVIFDQDDNRNTTDDQVVVKGHFKVEPKIIIKLKCSGFLCTKPDFTAKFVMDEEAKIEVKAKLKKELNKSQQLLRIPLGAITVGFLVFVPEIVVDVSLEGLIRVEVDYSATQSINYEVGVQYNSSTKWTKINKVNKSFTSNAPTFEASVEAKAKLTAAARLMLYGIAGVEADVGVYAKFEAQYPSSPAWILSGGIEGNIGVDLDLIVWQEELNVPIFNKTWSISQAQNTAPEFEFLGAKTTCPDGTTPRTLTNAGNQVVKLRAVVDDAEDGKGQVTIIWRTDRSNGDLGTTQPGSPHKPGFDLAPGAHIITAIAEDSNGRRTTKTARINVTDNLHCQIGVPLIGVDIQTQNNAIPIMNASRTLTFNAQTSGGLNTCCTITWSSDLEGVLGTSVGTNQPDLSRNHSFTHTFQFQTPQTITATITQNGTEVADSLYITALPLLTTTPNLSIIQPAAPSGTRYVYLNDTVSFNSTSSGTTPIWNSSVPSDSINEKTGSNVNTQFNSIGPRTITVTSQNADGGFASQTHRINVLNPLAHP
jgi:hypothetical protein